jgi:class 3 adenylate cyclase
MNESAIKRTLTAIVMTDVVGYSRMMGEDEAGTLQRLTQYRSDFIDPTIALHRGRIVDSIGDSLLLEFGSVVDAAYCAIALQQTIADRNASLPDPKRIKLRIGVNIGDVIVKDRTLYGDSVNVAARLQTLAEAGGICFSSAAFEQVRGKIDAEFADMGAHQVKNIARPIEVFALSVQAINEIQRRSPPKPAPSHRALVLSATAVVLLVAMGVSATYFVRRSTKIERAAQLGAILDATQAKLNERTRDKLIEDYFAIGLHRAFAIAPKAQARWWTGDWATSKAAEEKVLERCQIAYDEPCVLAALDEAIAAPAGESPRPERDMPKVRYSGDFDPAQIPAIRQLVSERADVVGYLQAPEPKAAAIHPRGIVAIVTGATTQRRAETQALKLCNDNDSRKEADGRCFLYAVANKIVLPQRWSVSASRP